MTNVECVSTGQLFGYRVDLIELTEFTEGLDLVETFDFGITNSGIRVKIQFVTAQITSWKI